MKHLKLFESFAPNMYIWIGYSQSNNGYCAGVVTQEEADILAELYGGVVEPTGNKVYAYINLERTEMSAEDSRFNIKGLGFVSADGEDNYDDEPDENRLVIELPREGIIVTAPDQNGWNASIMTVDGFIGEEEEYADEYDDED